MAAVQEGSEMLAIDNPEIIPFTTKKYLKKTDKGKLKWTGDFESLQIFIEKNLTDYNGSWTTPRGGCKEFHHSRIVLRWYINTQSLILVGEEANNIQDKLLVLAQQEEEQEPFNEDGIRDENLELSSKSYTSDDDDEVEGNKHSNFLEETVRMLENEMAKMYEEFKANKEQTDSSILELNTKVMSLHQLQPERSRDDASILELIQNENSVLRKENDHLRERIESLLFSLSAVNNKLKSADQEKESLLTVIRLLNEDLKIKSPVGAQQRSEDLLKRNSEEFQGRKKTYSKHETTTTTTNSMTNLNRFSVLPVHETSEDDDEVIEINKNEEPSQGETTAPPNGNLSKRKPVNTSSRASSQIQRSQHERPRDEHSPKDHQDRSNNAAVIVGDSMLKFIDARKLKRSPNQKVTVKTFPGARTEEMVHYMKPTLNCLNKQPSQLIGTLR